MGWAIGYIKKLKAGETVSFRPRGNSMAPKINSGDLVTVEPITAFDAIETDDIVLCNVGRNEYLHLVKSIRTRDGRWSFLIGNNRGGINGWAQESQMHGKLIRVEP